MQLVLTSGKTVSPINPALLLSFGIELAPSTLMAFFLNEEHGNNYDATDDLLLLRRLLRLVLWL